MAIPLEMQNAVNDFFDDYVTILGHNTILSDGNNYELYIYCKVVDALSRNFTVVPMGLHPDGSFHFRCSPGFINDNFSYFQFNTSSHSYQVRNGIVVGK